MGKSYMQYPRNFFYNLKKYGLTLSADEIKHTIISIVVIGFVLSFREWGGDTFSFITGLKNLGISILATTVAMFFYQLGQRIIGVYYGYNPEFKMSSLGIMLALVITFASRGRLIIFTPGYVLVHMLAASRLGEFRYYTNLWEWAKISFGGPLFCFFAAMILSLLPHNEFAVLHKMFIVCIYFAVFSSLPLPFNPGMQMFYYFRWFWVFVITFMIAGSLLLVFTNALIGLLGGALIGLISIAWFFVKYDKMIG